MRKNYIILVLTVIFAFSLRSQNLPYLNASAGNANQSLVDKDTNLYMFHGSRLEKVNKNLSPIWVNTYNNINFSNLLLSKTGAIYFIAQNKIGKINVNGGLDWVSTLTSITTGTQTTTTFNLKQLLLDRNNHLVITASNQKGFFIKLDTLGNVIKTRVFSPVFAGTDNFNVISDSLGNYKIYCDAVDLGGRAGFLFTYSETLESVINVRHLDSYDLFNSNPYGQPVFFYKSKFGSNFYIAIQSKNNISVGQLSIRKYNTLKGKLSSFAIGTWGIDSYFENFNEDEKGNVILSGRTVNNSGYDRGYELLDSNCMRLSGSKIINNQQNPTNPPFGSISSRPHVIHNNNYYFDALGTPFLSNPLTMTGITSSLSCYANMPIGSSGSCTSTNCFLGLTTSAISVTNPNTIVITPFTSTVTSISFSIVQNYCLILDAKENKKTENTEINIYPNPFRDKITINHTINTSIQLEIYNTLGGIFAKKELDKNIKEINLEEFPQGIYFVKIIFDNKFLVKKLIKE
ncbi:MAG: T9SS type A sorting domain-containing protein [Bacteroidota bacterium]